MSKKETQLSKALKQPEQTKELTAYTDQYTLKVAINRLCEELKKDKDPGSYYYAWQSNIAMPFVDAFATYAEEHEIEGSAKNFNVHEIANNAARNFLNLLISQPEKETNE